MAPCLVNFLFKTLKHRHLGEYTCDNMSKRILLNGETSGTARECMSKSVLFGNLEPAATHPFHRA